MADYKLEVFVNHWFPDWLGTRLGTGKLFSAVRSLISRYGWSLDALNFKSKATDKLDRFDFYLTRTGSITITAVVLLILKFVAGSFFTYMGYRIIKLFKDPVTELETQKVELEKTQTINEQVNDILANPSIPSDQKTPLIEKYLEALGYSKEQIDQAKKGIGLTDKIIIYGALGLGAMLLIMAVIDKPATATAPLVIHK